jgi:hypothetical protein
MTVAPDAPALRFSTLAEAIAALREHGRRLSTPRRLILEALFAADGPVAAPYLVDALSIEESSVYRNLEVLEGHGLVVTSTSVTDRPLRPARRRRGRIPLLRTLRQGHHRSARPARTNAQRRPLRVRLRTALHPLRARRALRRLLRRPAPHIRGRQQNRASRYGASRPQSPPGPARDRDRGRGRATHEHAHSHGDYVHTHPHPPVAAPRSLSPRLRLGAAGVALEHPTRSRNRRSTRAGVEHGAPLFEGFTARATNP